MGREGKGREWDGMGCRRKIQSQLVAKRFPPICATMPRLETIGFPPVRKLQGSD